MCQSVADEIGETRPSTVYGSSEKLSQQLLAHTNRVRKMMRKAFDWPLLTTEYTFSTSNGTAAYALPADFDRFLFTTHWNRTSGYPLAGPVTATEWQVIKSGLVGSTSSLYQRWRIKGASSTQFYLDPTPTATETLVFEYISKYDIVASGSQIGAFTADTNTFVLPEETVSLGVQYRYLLSRGMDYAQTQQDFENAMREDFIAQTGARVLSLAPSGGGVFIGEDNIPESGYGD